MFEVKRRSNFPWTLNVFCCAFISQWANGKQKERRETHTCVCANTRMLPAKTLDPSVQWQMMQREKKKKKTEQKTDCCAKLLKHDRNTWSSTVCENHTCSQTVSEYLLRTSCFLRLTFCSSRPAPGCFLFFLWTNALKEFCQIRTWRHAASAVAVKNGTLDRLPVLV